MRIVIVSQSYYPRPGGVTEHAFHSTRELARLGHEVSIVTSYPAGGAELEENVVRLGRNILVPMNSAWVNMTVGIRLGEKLRRLFERLEPDIIHTHCPLVPTLPLLSLRSAPEQTAVIGTFHAAARSNYAYRLLRGPLDRHAERIKGKIAVSQAARRLAQQYFPGEYRIIPNGIDYERFSPICKPIENLRDGRLNILFVGRFDKRKGVAYLIKGIAGLKNDVRRRIRLIIIGEKGPRRFLLPPLPEDVEVVFRGVVSREDLPRYYACSDIFCSPATGRESFGIVLLEAMAAGTAVIGTAISGYLTILRDRWNALVVPPKSASAITRALEELMDDQRLRLRLRENGLAFVKEYSWKKVAAKLDEFYREKAEPARNAHEITPGKTNSIMRMQAAPSK